MEFSGKFGGGAAFLWLSFCIFLTFSCTKAEHEKPLKNVNLSPFWQWRSAAECLKNTSTACGAQNLNMSGIIQVTGSSQVANYCDGCAHWTQYVVLACVRSVKRDFWFANNATVKLINDTINLSCANNSDIVVIDVQKSTGVRNFGGTYLALFSALVLAIFLFST